MEAERYPISVRLVGVLHKENTKFYMTSVLWSDQSDAVIYRRFQEFKNMHKQMKKAFPPANKLKKSDRTIPRFREKMKQKSRRKNPHKSLVRLGFLQKYCNALLSCDQRVCQSADLIKFFQPKDQDLQPEFTKNGIMIMPPENELRSEGGQGGNVTQPFVTEAYRCVAPYETKDTKSRPFKVAMDEKVDVIMKDKTGWWLVESEDKRLAWFPAPYLERVDNDDDENDDSTDGFPERGALYTAVKSYKAIKTDEITINIGSVVEVLQKSENGWWLVRYNAKVGYIPTMILQPCRKTHMQMTSQYQDRCTSPSLLVPFSSRDQQSQLSRSQGNLLQLPPARSPSPHMIQPDSKQQSRSLEVLSEPPPARLAPKRTVAAAATNVSTAPTIMVEMDGDEEQRARSLTGDSEDSFVSDSTDFSSTSSLNLSPTANDEQLRMSRTPPPMTSNSLSPTGGLERKLIPSVSDPNLYKWPAIPKVPPRPGAQEILTRCTTVTRKNAARDTAPPTQAEIISR